MRMVWQLVFLCMALLNCAAHADWTDTYKMAIAAQDAAEKEKAEHLYLQVIKELESLGEDASFVEADVTLLRRGQAGTCMEPQSRTSLARLSKGRKSCLPYRSRTPLSLVMSKTDRWDHQTTWEALYSPRMIGGRPFVPPKVRIIGDTVVVSSPHTPHDHEKARCMASRIFGLAELCESEKDVTVSPSGNVMIEVQLKCAAPPAFSRQRPSPSCLLRCGKSHLSIAPRISPPRVDHPDYTLPEGEVVDGSPSTPVQPEGVRNCIRRVNIVLGTVAGLASRIRSLGGVTFFLAVVEVLREKAIECCQSGKFYENCVAPIERFIAKFDPVDPAWD